MSQTTEHPSVLEPLRALARQGFEVTLVGVDGGGPVDLGRLAAALREDTVLVSVMPANNETGVGHATARVVTEVWRRGRRR